MTGTVSRAAAGASPLTRWKLLSYGGLAMPLALAGTPILTYLPAFYAQELRLPVGVVGLVFLFSRLADGLFDIIVGWLSDRSMSRWGRRKLWVVAGAPLLMASTWFVCSPMEGAGLGYLIAWVALFYTAWTVMYIPYLSWGAELATGYVERSRVTSFREGFTMLGSLFFAAAPLALLGANAPLREVLLLIAATVLVILPLATVPLALTVRDPAPQTPIEAHLLKGLFTLTKDRVLIRFIVATLLIFIGEGAINSLAVFAFEVGLSLPGKLFWVVFIIYVTTLCSLPLTLYVSRRVEKHSLLAAGLAIKAVGFAVHIFIPSGYFPIVAALWVMVGIVQTCIVVLPTSMLADIIDRGEAAEGERRSGAYVAVYNLAWKVGLALGVGVSFGLLALAGYDPAAADHGPTDVQTIRLLAFGFPAVLEAAAIVLLLRHPITRNVHQQLRAQIEAAG